MEDRDTLRFDCWCFDLDGTLIDIEARFTAIHQELIERLGGNVIPDYFAIRRAGFSEIDICGMSGLLPNQIRQYDTLREQMLEDYKFLKLDKLFAGTNPILDHLSHFGVNKWILTHRRNQEATGQQLRSLGLTTRFDGWVCTKSPLSDGTLAKGTLSMSPLGKMAAVGAKAEVLSRFALKYSTVLVCDDLPDILAAQQAGVTSIALSTGLCGPQILAQAKPHYLFETLVSLLTHLEGE